MNFSQFLLILRARIKIVLIVLAATVFVTALVSILLPKSYQATSTLVLNYKGTDPVTGVTLPAQLMPGYMATQVDLVYNISTALKVVDELKLDDDLEARENFQSATGGESDFRQWLAQQLLKELTVVPARDSSVLSISFTANDARSSAELANAFAKAYQEISVQVKVDPSKRAAHYYDEQLKSLRERVEAAQNKLSLFQQENGIVVTEGRVDNEFARLTTLSTQLAQAQAQTLEAASRMRAASGNRGAESPDVFGNSMIQNLKMQLAQAELKLNTVIQTYTEDHPQYLAAKAAVNSLRAELQQQIKANTNSLTNNAKILQEHENELRKAIDEQRDYFLSLNRKRDALKVLNTELDGAQRYYDAALQRYLQTNLEGQLNQADVVVLSPAAPPIKPASPKVLLNIALSIILGLLLGLGFAMLAETIDRRVRSPADLVMILGVPVLGVLGQEPAAPRRLGIQRLLLTHQPIPS